MSPNQFTYIDGRLCAEQVPLRQIANEYGTASYVYSRAAFEQQWQQLDDAFGTHPHTICYAVKANSNLAVLNLLARIGSGFDVVSEGELRRVVKAGGDASKTVFSGVAKSRSEIEFALNQKIGCINIESVAELHRIQEVAQSMDKVAPIAVRVNPDVDPKTHPYISTGLKNAKFGISMQTAIETYQLANQLANIEIHGVACHIGSQIVTTSPFKDSVDKVLELVKELAELGIHLKQLDLGGGLGIDYQGETPPSATDWISSMLSALKAHQIDLPVSIEPGRYIAGNSGVLLTQIEYLKCTPSKNFAVIDAGMHNLLRPSLYQAYHKILTLDQEPPHDPLNYDVVGPICESTDVLGVDRELAVAPGDYLAIMSAGAYAFVMASNYNSWPRPPEIMVDGDQIHCIKRRENHDDLITGETLLP